ncbi:uncharacterized protein LOC115808764 [Chanos chanos]|uniref:Uncharacterized protein LOC115808764 n=1 Tax=Chanos chanos TaxID=29144 RepID=A0A6J2V1G8_CHACN|nr:uncharacterized protein LOC115808764 [Chanos chanos]
MLISVDFPLRKDGSYDEQVRTEFCSSWEEVDNSVRQNASRFLALAQGKPKVTLFPPFKLVYVGDEIHLNCKDSSSPVKWHFNGVQQSETEPTLRIPTATSANSGVYVCEKGERSEEKRVTVLDSLPPASLSIKMGFPVMSGGDGVVVELTVDDGLDDWWCAIARGTDPRNVTVNRSKRDMFTGKHYTVTLHVDLEHADRAMVWCVKKSTTKRSNAIILRKTDSMVVLEPPVTPALEGERLVLRCVVWGNGRIDQVTFYKDNSVIRTGKDPNFTISNVTQADKADYSCQADYTFSTLHPNAAVHTKKSDPQPLRVIGSRAPRAYLSESSYHLTCSCPRCPDYRVLYYWYYRDSAHEQGEKLTSSPPGETMTVTDGKKQYACQAVWDDGRSLMSKYSKADPVPPPPPNIVVLIIILLIVLGLAIALLACWRKRRAEGESTGRRGKREDGADGGYEAIKVGQEGKEIYHTLKGEEGKEEGGGGYEALKQREKEVYQTLGAEGEGGYEALKGQKKESETYHTLGPTGAGGDGGYEALKGKGRETEVYHTLKTAEGGGDGGYQALQKAEGDGGYEQLKMKEVKQKNEDYEGIVEETV